MFSAISHSSSYGEVITSDHCSVIGLNSLTKRDGRWLKLLISKGKFTVDAIETIIANRRRRMVMLLRVMVMVKMTKDN